MINVFLLFVGLAMEMIASMVILVPLLVPILKTANIDLVHFGVVMVANLCIGALTPPLAVLVFTAARVTDTPIHLAYRACRPFMVGLLIWLAMISFVPALSLYAGEAVRTMSFTLTEDVVALPTGAWAGAHRRTLRHDGKPVLALSQGKHRAYVYPLFTPQGYAVTSEHPADHPHHNSFWIAADHVYCRMPVTHGKGYEDYTYNIYLDETFQGRAPGRIVETDLCRRGGGRHVPHHPDARLARAARMGGAGGGRLAARETRTLAHFAAGRRACHRRRVASCRGRLGLHAWADAPCLFQRAGRRTR